VQSPLANMLAARGRILVDAACWVVTPFEAVLGWGALMDFLHRPAECGQLVMSAAMFWTALVPIMGLGLWSDLHSIRRK
jgi:hypothetical protein